MNEASVAHDWEPDVNKHGSYKGKRNKQRINDDGSCFSFGCAGR